MRLGYNTNGLAHHRWPEAIELIAECGYRSVAITLDQHCLDPYSETLDAELRQMRKLLGQHELHSVIETGARFLLNPRIKHEPTLVSTTPDERAVRVDFLKRCIEIAARLGADAVSFWAGVLHDDADGETAFARLEEGCRQVADFADRSDVRLAFEPEPGMVVESFEQFDRLSEAVDAPHFGLTIDIGHVQCVEDEPIADCLKRYSDRIHNLHIEDMARGVHQHLRFGAGEIDFPPVISALHEIGYTGGVHVELSRHSHMAPTVLRESYEFLSRLV
ncbi:MAG: isomerase [Planctomycetaceae bacterium]|nr:isomerase [Planctomycetaceae bacterium]